MSQVSQRLPAVLEGIASATGISRRPFTVNTKLVYIANDSTNYDIKVNFNKTVDEEGTFTLKAGEIISDLPLICTTISLQGVGGSAEYRVMGV